MKSVAISEFKANCLTLLDDVARTGRPLVVTRHGRPLARVLPTSQTDDPHPQDTLAGTVTIVGDVVTPVIAQSAWHATRGILTPRARPKRKRP